VIDVADRFFGVAITSGWDVAPDPLLKLERGAGSDDAAVIDHDDVLGELVCLVEVLGGEQYGRALCNELAGHLPQRAAAGRSSPAVGSLRKTKRGRATTLAARSSRRSMPPE